MSTKTTVRIAYAALVPALVAAIASEATQGTAWWVWAIWGAIAAGVVAVHVAARRNGLM